MREIKFNVWDKSQKRWLLEETDKMWDIVWENVNRRDAKEDYMRKRKVK